MSIGSPDFQELLQQAIADHNAGRTAQAEAIYRQILAVDPAHSDALHLLGILHGQTGRPEVAIEFIARAISARPQTPLYLDSMAESYRRMGKLAEAADYFRQTCELEPGSAGALSKLGWVLRDLGRFEEAAAAFSRAIEIQPESADLHNNLGVCLMESGKPREAITEYRRAIQIKPDYENAWGNLGNALVKIGQFDEVIDACRQALRLNPKLAEAHLNLGLAMLARRDVAATITSFRRAIALRADFAEAHFNLAQALLLDGNLPEGWRENEWRWRCKGFPTPLRCFTQPIWDGTDLAGRIILLHCEQGYGDSIQFIRYASLVAQRGGRVVLWAPPELLALMQTAQGVQSVVTAEPFPPFDVHCPLLSLPRVLDTWLETIPATVPYLFADPVRAARFNGKVAVSAKGLRVGLVWAGRPTHANDRNRSITLEQLTPLATITGTSFFNLQKDHSPAAGPSGIKLIDFTDEIHDFADTAALIENLDLVITVDTSAAHLAGAMGKPVWVLLPFSPDWRWLLDREDSPWYPTMRLFRQKQPGNWETTILELTKALDSQVKKVKT